MFVLMWEENTVWRRISLFVAELKKGDLNGFDLRVISHLRSEIKSLDNWIGRENSHLWEKITWVIESDRFKEWRMLV